MAKHRLATFKQSECPMHEYILKFTDLVEHTHNLQPTDTASTIVVSHFIEGITNPHIKNKLGSYKISNLQDIFTFALQEYQKQNIRSLDFEDKSDTIAQCDANAIKANICYKCGGEGHFIKDCPQNNDNPTQNQRKPSTKYNNRSTSNTTCVITPIAQTLNSLLKQLNTSNTTTHNTSSYHKFIKTTQTDTDITNTIEIQNTIVIALIIDIKHTMKIDTIRDTTIDMIIEKWSMK